jgi:hypothetical protein
MLLLAVDLVVTLVKQVGPGGVRVVMAETLVLKQQMMIGKRSFDDYPWEAHCRERFELPVAA